MNRNAIIDLLRSKSIDVTKARVEILDFLLKNHAVLTSLPEILKLPGKRFNRITVYRTLVTLCNIGLAYKIIDINNRPFYAVDKSLKPNHNDLNQPSSKEFYHFQCTSCNSVICLPTSFQDIKLPEGFIKRGAILLLTGYCSKCSGSTKKMAGKKVD